MNNDLSLWDSTLLLPASFEQACQRLQGLAAQPPGPNRKFLAFAQALQSRAGIDADWAAQLARHAERAVGAVWHLSLPADHLIAALQAVVEHATARGLVVLSEPLGMMFLPGGAIEPREMQAQWAQLTRQTRAAPALTKTEVTQLTATLMRDRLAAHGFVPRRLEDDWDAQFVRPTPDGFQSVQMRVIGRSPSLRCVVSCAHRNEAVEAHFEQVFGPGIRMPATFWFNPSVFVGSNAGDMPIENAAEVRAVLAVIERHGLPPLDLARERGGLDRLMNEPERFPIDNPARHPDAPKNLADEYVSYGRDLCLKPLIVAWLACNPTFDQRVADIRAFVRQRVDVSEADLERMVDHLRALPA